MIDCGKQLSKNLKVLFRNPAAFWQLVEQRRQVGLRIDGDSELFGQQEYPRGLLPLCPEKDARCRLARHVADPDRELRRLG